MARKKARVRYIEDYEESGREGYVIEFYSDVDKRWKTEAFYHLFAISELGESNDFVHYSIINHINHLIHMGYTFVV